jgi:hypothetical protein
MISQFQEDEFPFENCAKQRTTLFRRRVKKGPPVQYRWQAWLGLLNVTSKVSDREYDGIGKPEQDIRV